MVKPLGNNNEDAGSYRGALLVLAARRFPGGGRLGMTFCLGKKGPNALYGARDRDLDTDLAAIRAWHAGLLVSLIEVHGFDLLEVPDLGARAQALGLSWLHLPTADVPRNLLQPSPGPGRYAST